MSGPIQPVDRGVYRSVRRAVTRTVRPVLTRTVWPFAVLAALSAWHAVRQIPSDVPNYRRWIDGPLPSWDSPGPYPVAVDALWWPLRWYHGTTPNALWVLGWTAPATVISCLLLWRAARHRVLAVNLWLLTATLLERAYWVRLEPVTCTIALAAVLLARRGRAGGSASALALGGLVKVWPVFLAPLLLVTLPGAARRRWAGWFALPWLAFAAAVALLRPPAATDWLTFAIDRRIQLESPTALAPLWAMAFGSHRWSSTFRGGLDSANLLVGPHLHALHLALQVCGAALLAVVGVRLIRWLLDRHDRFAAVPDPIAQPAQTVLLLVLMITAPVLSPQYLAWFAPVLVVAAGEGLLLTETAVWLVGCALTTLEYPYLWDRITAGRPLGVAALTLRDAVLVTLLVMCLRRLWSATRRPPVAHAPEGQVTSTSMVCQPLAPSGAGGA